VKAFSAAAAAVMLALAAPALASDAHPTLAELEGEVMCPICQTTLDQSNSAAAQRIKAFIVRRIRAGDSKREIERRLVADFGPAILAQPPKRGFDLLAWLLPIAGVLAGAVAVGVAAWRWSRRREPDPALAGVGRLDPELERRLDEELRRFDE
jgi:cytochrome c-type biogenesis protein CcmH